MKKHLFILTAVLLTAVMPMHVYAEEVTETSAGEQAETQAGEMFSYTLDAGGNAQITDFLVSDSYTGEIVIPQEIDGHIVTYLDNAAFMNAKGITGVTIPATVTDMGNSVFFGCENLERFTVESGNTYFSVVDDGVLMADNNQFLVAYPAAKAGETYTIPAATDEIAPGCFGFAKNLKEITIPESVVYIDKWAFAYSHLEKIVVSSGVMQIDDYAFAYCEQLRDVTLQSGLESIYDAAFSCCPALTEITLPDTLTYVGQCAFCGTGMTSVTIPASVAEIDYCAFGYDKDLNALSSFVIYGNTNTEAQNYCTAIDVDNDYENNFTFISIDDAAEPEDSAPAEETNQETDRETDAEGAVLTEQNTEAGTDAGLSGMLGAELKNNSFLQILLATVGGIAVVLALTLIILMIKKPKNKQDDES